MCTAPDRASRRRERCPRRRRQPRRRQASRRDAAQSQSLHHRRHPMRRRAEQRQQQAEAGKRAAGRPCAPSPLVLASTLVACCGQAGSAVALRAQTTIIAALHRWARMIGLRDGEAAIICPSSSDSQAVSVDSSPSRPDSEVASTVDVTALSLSVLLAAAMAALRKLPAAVGTQCTSRAPSPAAWQPCAACSEL
jgi:hypothetical protein